MVRLKRRNACFFRRGSRLILRLTTVGCGVEMCFWMEHWPQSLHCRTPWRFPKSTLTSVLTLLSLRNTLENTWIVVVCVRDCFQRRILRLGGLDRGTVDDAWTKTISLSLTPGTGLILFTNDGLLEMRTSRMLFPLCLILFSRSWLGVTSNRIYLPVNIW